MDGDDEEEEASNEDDTTSLVGEENVDSKDSNSLVAIAMLWASSRQWKLLHLLSKH